MSRWLLSAIKDQTETKRLKAGCPENYVGIQHCAGYFTISSN